MKIVTDRGTDLSAEQSAGLEIHYVPMRLMLDGKTYSSGEDIQPEQFYELMAKTDGFPSTSQATAGDFARIYRELAKEDPDILSLHISGGLSGTLDSAKAGAEMVPEAHVTFWDTKWLSCPEGWQVEFAARALKAGWTLEQILVRLEVLRSKTVAMFTLDTLKYLIHGGRISHMKGLLASLLHILPVITVDQESGKYTQLAQERTMKRALQKMPELMVQRFGTSHEMRVQLIHGMNPEMVAVLKSEFDRVFRCKWLPTLSVAPVLGAHTGGGVVAISIAPADIYEL